MIRRIALGLVVVVALVFAGFSIYVASRQNLKFDAPYPAIAAASDSTTIERGRYIVRNVAPCSGCHGDQAQVEADLAGAEVPLSGGYAFEIPPGKFYARNITPDAETGIGRLSDGAVARALRNGIGHDGRALLPFMEMQGLSDEDLTAVVSYLRSRPAVRNAVPNHEYTLLGMAVRATVLANPVGPPTPPPATSPRGANVENGRYLVEAVALCGACHTQRDMMTGAFTGPRFGGSTGFTSTHDAKVSWSPPNITTDPTTGKLGALTEDGFVARMRTGRVIPGSPMPWQAYQGMADEDLRAMYQYLKSVPAVANDVGPAMVTAK